MIMYPVNGIVGVLLFVLVGATDTYILIITVRLILGQVPAARSGRACLLLQEFADPIPRHLHQRITAWRRRPAPTWLSWAAVIVAAVIARHALQWMLLASTR